jgi:hypothetical protein
MMAKEFAFSTEFKTQPVYGYQPITAGAVTKKLLVMYYEVLRPIIQRKMASGDAEPGMSDPLFLTFDGEGGK